MKTRHVLMFWWVWLCLLSGCASVPLTHYYTFHPVSIPNTVATSPKYPFILAIDKFAADVQYQQDRIVFRPSPYEINFYEYHRWIQPPNELVTACVLNMIASQELFRQVHTAAFEWDSDYILQGKIKLFDQWHSQGTSSIRVTIQYQVLLTTTEQRLWMDTVETEKTLSTFEIVEIVKGFEAAVQENILQALAGIDNVLQRQQ